MRISTGIIATMLLSLLISMFSYAADAPAQIPAKPTAKPRQLALSVESKRTAAQSLGAKVGARRAGTVGECGLFSLGPGKALSTGGGGIVCTQDAALAERLRVVWQRLPSAGAAASIEPRQTA